MSNIVLFVSHKEKQCGVYQFGYNIGHVLEKSTKYHFIYVECSSQAELERYVKEHDPICTIYNHQGATLPWVKTFGFKSPQVGLIHEVTQKVADATNNTLFDYHIAPDPTLVLKNPIVYKTGRLLLRGDLQKKRRNDIPVIGSFGFGARSKNFNLLVQKVCAEFDEAVIRLNIAFAEFGDKDGRGAKKAVEECTEIVKKHPNIKLICSHEFLNDQKLLEFLGSNTINVFLYSDNGERGISSAIDYALSVRVPVAVSADSGMFRHIAHAKPSIVATDTNTLRSIIVNGTEPLEPFYREWTEENLLWDYERIVTDIDRKFKAKRSYGLNRPQYIFLRRVKRYVQRRFLGKPIVSGVNHWSGSVKDYRDMIDEYDPSLKYKVADVPIEKLVFNRILNDEARRQYRSSVDFLHEILPRWMERKVEKANIQQGFVLDTIVRLTEKTAGPKVFCVGSFEDTAFAALKKLGYDVSGVDPVLNYDLDTYLTKPSTKIGCFDAVFSTSVIEHVEDDVDFLRKMSLLTKEGGYLIVTCDFKEGYKPGDPKPGVDYRLYTREHLQYLLSEVPGLTLVGDPDWRCPNPDFGVEPIRYAFASMVLRKKS